MGAPIRFVHLETLSADTVISSFDSPQQVWWRGWMLNEAEYRHVHRAVSAAGGRLRTGVDEYRAAHELPGWHAAFTGLTADAVWTVGDSRELFEQACRQLGNGAAVLRDYVKSAKHAWFTACFVS